MLFYYAKQQDKPCPIEHVECSIECVSFEAIRVTGQHDIKIGMFNLRTDRQISMRNMRSKPQQFVCIILTSLADEGIITVFLFALRCHSGSRLVTYV